MNMVSSNPTCQGHTLRSLQSVRFSSSTAIKPSIVDVANPYRQLQNRVNNPKRTFERLSTQCLLRSVILGQLFKSPLLLKPGLRFLEKIANSKSKLLDVDRNPLIRGLVLPLIYRQFCAGRNVQEVKQTISDIKAMGYSGVILCYSGEVMARRDATGKHSKIEAASDAEATQREIAAWSKGNLATLDAVSEGDYIGVKFTGAGPSISQALKDGQSMPPLMLSELHELCTRAAKQNKQIWIDAEQQVYHPTIDNWATDLMRKHNRDGKAVILTTIQAYLKSSRSTVNTYLQQAHEEGWTLGIKLVRGAYIASDIRINIHDTKAETDASYDGIVKDILSKSWPGFHNDKFPKVQLFLAGHNTESVRKASTLVQALAQKGKIEQRVCYGQLQGMADDIGCELLALGEQATRDGSVSTEQARRDFLGSPKAYKCLTWGSVKECLHYLVRRAIENQGAAERMNTGLVEMKQELRRRALRF